MVTSASPSPKPDQKADSHSTKTCLEVCVKGHHHYPSCWTIYAVDPDGFGSIDSYKKALHPTDVFDTFEEAEHLYEKPVFSKNLGRPSVRMTQPGAAIAIFRGGRYGIPAVKPDWDDPAAANGIEFRFLITSAQKSASEAVDSVFHDVVLWMCQFSGIDGATPLGCFIKNIFMRHDKTLNSKAFAPAGPTRKLRLDQISLRVWFSQVASLTEENEGRHPAISRIAAELNQIFLSCGVIGDMSWERLADMKVYAQSLAVKSEFKEKVAKLATVDEKQAVGV